jgi:hypothetical protein
LNIQWLKIDVLILKFRSGNLYVMKIKAILTGATGMIGEGVLHEC